MLEEGGYFDWDHDGDVDLFDMDTQNWMRNDIDHEFDDDSDDDMDLTDLDDSDDSDDDNDDDIYNSLHSDDFDGDDDLF